MPDHQITCAECHQPHVAKRSDARFCPPCRLLRVLLFVDGKFARAKRCRGCRALFRPMHARDLSYCGACEALTRNPVDPRITCAFCRKDEHPALRKSPVLACVVCAKDPDTRPLVIKALRKGRRLRLQTQPAKEHHAAG